MTHVRMILNHLCLCGMVGIIQSKITLRIYFATLVMFYVVNFLPFLLLSRSFFSNFGQGPFPKIAGKSPGYSLRGESRISGNGVQMCKGGGSLC